MTTPGTIDVSIVTSGHDVADARIHRICAALRRGGLSVEVLGLGRPEDGPADVAVRTTARGSMARRAFLAVRYAAGARGRVVVALDPDSLLTSLVLGRLRRLAVVADVHEDYAALLRDRSWARGWRGRVAAVLAQVATAAARASDLVVVADTHVPPSTARRRIVLRNLPDPHFLPEPGERGPRPRALYVGDVRGSRGLWSMLDALAGAPDWSLDVVGPVAGADQPRLDEALREGDLVDRVRFHGRMPPAQAWALAAGAWCGFVLLEDTPAFRDAVPSKLYEYLATGLAVVVTDLPRQRALVEEAGAGAVVRAAGRTGADTAEVLNAWQADPAEVDRLRAAAASWTVAGSGASEYDVLVAAVEDLLHPTTAGRPVR